MDLKLKNAIVPASLVSQLKATTLMAHGTNRLPAGLIAKATRLRHAAMLVG